MPRTKSPFAIAGAALVVSASAALAEAPPLETEGDRILYTLGVSLSRQLRSFDLTPAEVAIIQQGIGDGLLVPEPRVSLQEYGPKIDGYLRERLAAAVARERQAGLTHLATMAAEPGALRLESGAVFVALEPGDGPHPGLGSTVLVHYEGRLRDGTLFDSSRQGGQPSTVKLDEAIPCLAEGVRQMSVGGKARLACPPELGYGDEGFAPLIPPGATLLFELELLGIIDTSGVPEAAP